MHPGQPHEPGWLGGELNGKVGWFPEAYVELADAAASDAAAATLQPIGKMYLLLKYSMVSYPYYIVLLVQKSFKNVNLKFFSRRVSCIFINFQCCS